MKKIFLNLFICLFVYLFIQIPAFAQTLPPNSLTVTPSLLSLDLSKDQPQGMLTYINTTDKTLEVSFSASDFAPLEDGYKLSFLQEKDAANYHYSLSSWIDFSSKKVTIAPHDHTDITVFVDKDKLTPGGHYASVLAEVETKGEGSVQIRGILSSLLFVRTNTGTEKEEAKIVGFFPNQTFINFPEALVLRLNNTGDTTITPFGLVTITDPFGNFVAKGILNESSAPVLPESIRRFETPIHSLTGFFPPGIYTAHIKLHFGKKNIVKDSTTTFISQGSLPLWQTGVGTLVFGVGYMLFRRFLPRKLRKED